MAQEVFLILMKLRYLKRICLHIRLQSYQTGLEKTMRKFSGSEYVSRVLVIFSYHTTVFFHKMEKSLHSSLFPEKGDLSNSQLIKL